MRMHLKRLFPILLLACSACPSTAQPALEQLRMIAGERQAASAAIVPGIKAAPAVQTPAKAIPPGTGLSPTIDDQGRVELILKIIDDIYNGRPLRFPKDGTVFDNREGSFPPRPYGYYREYTLLPPEGSPRVIRIGGKAYTISPPQGTRGAERLIIGGGETLYYTPDHYKTFIQLEVLR